MSKNSRKKAKNKNIKYGSEVLEKKIGVLTFAKLIKSYREGEGYTQKELADILNIAKGSLCDLEKGKENPVGTKGLYDCIYPWHVSTLMGANSYSRST